MFEKISQKISASPLLFALAIVSAIIVDIIDLIEKIYDYPRITILVIITIITVVLKEKPGKNEEKLQLVPVKSPNRIAIMTVLAMALVAVVVSSYIWLFCCPSKVCVLDGYVKMAPVSQNGIVFF